VTTYLLVDGYNLINQCPELLALNNLEHARDRLVSILSNYQALTGWEVTLVFDAHLVKGGIEEDLVLEGIRVVYTKEEETADMFIEKTVSFLVKTQNEVYVGTSDYAEQRMILGRGAYRISSRELIALIKEAVEKNRKHYRTPTSRRHSIDLQINEETRRQMEKWRRKR